VITILSNEGTCREIRVNMPMPKMIIKFINRGSRRIEEDRGGSRSLMAPWPTNPHWARVVGYGPYSLCVIHKEGLCPSSRDINRLMMMFIDIPKLNKQFRNLDFFANENKPSSGMNWELAEFFHRHHARYELINTL
jgi:hypothetical protein